MMMEKEDGKLEGSQFPSLWEAKNLGSGEKRYHVLNSRSQRIAPCIDIHNDFRYYNVVTGLHEREIKERYRGGLLADVRQSLTTFNLREVEFIQVCSLTR